MCVPVQYSAGVWAMCTWEQMGRPRAVRVVELGPGRGTLMADLLRGTARFNEFTAALHVHMVEVRPASCNFFTPPASEVSFQVARHVIDAV